MSRSRKQLQEQPDNKASCYVLITCSEPSDDGQMEVEMTYKGDAALASYLIQGAQSIIDQENESDGVEVNKAVPMRRVK